MKMCIVGVKDNVAGLFGRPIFTHSEAMAIRAFADELNRPDGSDELHRHPEDFDLYLLGHFDDVDGVVTGNDGSTILAKGAAMKRPRDA